MLWEKVKNMESKTHSIEPVCVYCGIGWPAFSNLNRPFPSSLVFWVFPFWVYSLLEEVKISAYWEHAGLFDVIVETAAERKKPLLVWPRDSESQALIVNACICIHLKDPF